jgi:hypothetical protein
MIEQLEKRIAELQNNARQHELAMIQISGAIQELTNLVSQLKGANDAAQTRDFGQNPAG